MTDINWICKPFDALTPHELYAVMQLRSEVFVVEQNCVFLDADGNDQFCWHLMGWKDSLLVAYTRLVPPGRIYFQASIGRVVTSPKMRRIGLGYELMKRAIATLYNIVGEQPIRIGAQRYLKQFYESFDFRQEGDEYTEDGIPHIYMMKV